MDQAQSLREYMERLNGQEQTSRSARVITITSGKGGVGKSNFTLNFSLALKASGKKVVIMDFDLSTANIDILMGITPKYRLIDILHRQKTIWDVLQKGTEGIEYISGGLEIQELIELDQEMLSFFWSQIQELQSYADYILLDTGAGVSKELVEFILASDETIMITTPEPTSIADSYAVMKTAVRYGKQLPTFRLVVNRAHHYREAVDTSRALKDTCRKFLKFELKTLGFLMEDVQVQQSVRSQIPFFIAYPKCEASKNIKQVVYSFLPDATQVTSLQTSGIRGFFEKILSFGKSL